MAEPDESSSPPCPRCTAADPAVTRHLAAFLRRHAADSAQAVTSGMARPDAILFNGGALTPALVRDRLVEVVASWFPAEGAGAGGFAPRVLSNTSLDLAVAQGHITADQAGKLREIDT